MKRGRRPKPAAPMIEDYLAGFTIQKVAERNNSAPSTVRRALDRAGISRRSDADPAADAAILRLRDDLGLSWATISQYTNIPASTLSGRYARLKRSRGEVAGESARQRRRGSQLEWGLLARAYESGEVTVAGIASASDLDEGTVRYHLRRHGAELTGNHRMTLKLSDAQLRDRYADGMTYQQLAEMCGVSVALVWRRVNLRPDADAKGAASPPDPTLR